MKIVTGTKSQQFVKYLYKNCKDISNNDDLFIRTEVKNFNDNETFIKILDNVRKEDVFVVQSISDPANESFMELLITIDALKRSSASSINVVMPYYGYARQDRKTDSRTPITAKLVADLMTKAGATRLCTMDLHQGQIQGFFDIPVDNLEARPIFIDDIKEKYNDFNNIVVVSPDLGGVQRVRKYATHFNTNIAIIDKRREKAGESDVMNIIGDVKNKDCIIVDDLADTAGTLCKGADALINNGAKSVSAYVTHGVLSTDNQGKSAIQKINESAFDDVVVTNTIEWNTPSDELTHNKKVRKLDVSPLFNRAIKHICNGSSISKLFD